MLIATLLCKIKQISQKLQKLSGNLLWDTVWIYFYLHSGWCVSAKAEIMRCLLHSLEANHLRAYIQGSQKVALRVFA